MIDDEEKKVQVPPNSQAVNGHEEGTKIVKGNEKTIAGDNNDQKIVEMDHVKAENVAIDNRNIIENITINFYMGQGQAQATQHGQAPTKDDVAAVVTALKDANIIDLRPVEHDENDSAQSESINYELSDDKQAKKQLEKLVNTESENLIDKIKDKIAADNLGVDNVASDVSLKVIQDLQRSGAGALLKCEQKDPGSKKTIMIDHLFDAIGDDKDNFKKFILLPLARGDQGEKPAKEKFYVFLSALTKNAKDENSLEYKVAKKLKEFFDEIGIGAFWWEDDEAKNIAPNISTKIALGLAFSTVFVGMSFDSSTLEKTYRDAYRFDALLREGEDKAKQTFFDYEVTKFHGFASEQEGDAARKEFVGDALSDEEFKEYIPQEAKFNFFAYGSTAFPDYIGLKDKEPICLNDDGTTEEEKIESLVKQIVIKLCANQNCDAGKIKNAVLRYARNYSITDESDEECINHVLDNYFSNLVPFPNYVEDKSTPADYFFNYIVLDSDNPAKEAVSAGFKFFVERGYTNDVPHTKINLVVNDWNESFCQNTPLTHGQFGGKLDETKILPLAKYQTIRVKIHSDQEDNTVRVNQREFDGDDASKYGFDDYAKNGGKIDICEWAESSSKNGITGKIEFSNPYDIFREKVDVKKTFDFVINCFKKHKWLYSVKEIDGKVAFVFDKKLPENIARFMVYYSAELPIKCNTQNYSKKKLSIKSTNLEDKVEIAGTTLKTNLQFAQNMKYRLTCMPNSSDDMFNLFVFKNAISNEERYSDSNCYRPIKRCPYCARELDLKKIKRALRFPYEMRDGRFVRRWVDCKGDKLETLRDDKGESVTPAKVSDRKTRKRVVCTSDIRNTFALPQGIEYVNTATIALFADSNVGKSTFISKMFGITPSVNDYKQFLNNWDVKKNPENGINTGSNYIDMAMKPYCGSYSVVKPQELSYRNGVESAWVDKEYKYAYQELEKNDLKYYSVPYTTFVSGTTTGKATVLRNHPFVAKVWTEEKGASYLSFVDIPGSDSDKYDETLKGNIDAVVFLLTAKESMEKIQNTYNQITQIAQKGIPLAIMCSKFDKIEGEFAASRSILRTLPPIPPHEGETNGFATSELKHYIDLCSNELEMYLKSIPDTKSITLMGNQNKKFFAVSSLGRSDTTTMNKGTQKMSFSTNPKGIENVILWLSYQLGFID